MVGALLVLQIFDRDFSRPARPLHGDWAIWMQPDRESVEFLNEIAPAIDGAEHRETCSRPIAAVHGLAFAVLTGLDSPMVVFDQPSSASGPAAMIIT